MKNRKDTNYTICIVDDDKDEADFLTDAIESAALPITIVHIDNIESIINQIHQVQPTLILLDVNLSGSSGIDVLKQVKDDPKSAQIPVVLISNVINEKVREESMILGAADFIAKPAGMAEYTSVVQKLYELCKASVLI